MRQYERKGIFTVKQLSYLFKPRKRKKGGTTSSPVTHKVELQALAIREQKIYLQELPTLSRQPMELFVDMEGIPDRGLYYLIGLLVCQRDTTVHHAFWADTDQDERHIWQQFVDMVTQYPDAPIYHYGGYERRAIAQLAKRYDPDAASLTKRLININHSVYGHVYFPVPSNSLKDIGHFLGAQWTSPHASGLQSLVWRHAWEQTQETTYREQLMTYNKEDCHELKILTGALSQFQQAAETLAAVDFADQRKRQTTEPRERLHGQFRALLTFTHFDYDTKKIRFRDDPIKETAAQERARNRRSASKLQHKLAEKKRQATRCIHVPLRTVCPQCGFQPLVSSKREVERTIIDIVQTPTSMRKAITSYRRAREYCPVCRKYYADDFATGHKGNQLYGHGFQAWAVYQRVAFRLPYESIVESLLEQFHEHINICCIPTFMKHLAQYYTSTEQAITRSLLESPFLHVDETEINIHGSKWYIWVFTDEHQVLFKLTDTREADIVHQLLANYGGILISDFYAGYDAVPCAQQKCWVHLIRDLNNDLLGAPFDTELEDLVEAVRDLILPIMECIQRHRLQQRKLHKFKNKVKKFYQYAIQNTHYRSDLAIKYHKRFLRYRDSLFTFLEHDAILWHNNPAERAIRPIAKQRLISTSLSASVTRDYLVLLGIRQTCRFQGKSFFQFLFSGETDLEHFDVRTRTQQQAGYR